MYQLGFTLDSPPNFLRKKCPLPEFGWKPPVIDDSGMIFTDFPMKTGPLLGCRKNCTLDALELGEPGGAATGEVGELGLGVQKRGRDFWSNFPAKNMGRWSMYGISTYIYPVYPINDPNVSNYSIHGSSGMGSWWICLWRSSWIWCDFPAIDCWIVPKSI